jgi:hypothetical protein
MQVQADQLGTARLTLVFPTCWAAGARYSRMKVNIAKTAMIVTMSFFIHPPCAVHDTPARGKNQGLIDWNNPFIFL